MDLAPELQPGKQPSALARFWAEALDEFEIRACDDDEIARLASIGRTPETDSCLIVDGPSLEICFRDRRPADGEATDAPRHRDA